MNIRKTPLLIARSTSRLNKSISTAQRRAAHRRMAQRMARMKHALAPLRETEMAFKTLADRASFGLVISRLVNNKTAILYANGAFCRMTGYLPSEIKTVDTDAFFQPCDLKLAYQRYRARISGSMPFARYETRLVRKDKSTVPVEVTGMRSIWEGHPANLIIFFDLSDKIKSEASRKEYALRYQALTDSSPDMIFLVDRTGRVRYVNPRADSLRRSKRRIVGHPLSNLFPPDTAALYLRSIRSVLRTGKLFLAPPQRLPGSNMWIEMRFVPIRAADGGIKGVMAIGRDITKRKQAEEALT